MGGPGTCAKGIAPLPQAAMSHVTCEAGIILVSGHPVDERQHVVEAVNIHLQVTERLDALCTRCRSSDCSA